MFLLNIRKKTAKINKELSGKQKLSRIIGVEARSDKFIFWLRLFSSFNSLWLKIGLSGFVNTKLCVYLELIPFEKGMNQFLPHYK